MTTTSTRRSEKKSNRQKSGESKTKRREKCRDLETSKRKLKTDSLRLTH